jgi:hypothetical protein
MKMLGFVAALAASSVVASAQVEDLTDAPIAHVWNALPSPTPPDSVVVEGKYPSIVATVLNDSLRVVISWSHIQDSLGQEDSTVMRVQSTAAFRLPNSNLIAADTWKRRKHLPNRLADTFRLAMPALGDSVFFQADSVMQCRLGLCSSPGGAGWGYRRTVKPPSMTLIRVTVDSF